MKNRFRNEQHFFNVCVVGSGQRLVGFAITQHKGVCMCRCSVWPGDIIPICPVSVSQDASGRGASQSGAKRGSGRKIPASVKPSQGSLRNQIEEAMWDLQEKGCSETGGESLAGSEKQGRAEERTSSGRPTVDFLSRNSSVLGHMDPDPSSYGAHLLASVTQKCLKLLWCTGEWAQSHTAFTCKQQFSKMTPQSVRHFTENKV